ncbi:hypothetical protein DIPPA_00937 [Diplonema papillatum]|nr:hypothetical protein DIPPA_00937 [Diplonema papillatum]
MRATDDSKSSKLRVLRCTHSLHPHSTARECHENECGGFQKLLNRFAGSISRTVSTEARLCFADLGLARRAAGLTECPASGGLLTGLVADFAANGDTCLTAAPAAGSKVAMFSEGDTAWAAGTVRTIGDDATGVW